MTSISATLLILTAMCGIGVYVYYWMEVNNSKRFLKYIDEIRTYYSKSIETQSVNNTAENLLIKHLSRNKMAGSPNPSNKLFSWIPFWRIFFLLTINSALLALGLMLLGAGCSEKSYSCWNGLFVLSFFVHHILVAVCLSHE